MKTIKLQNFPLRNSNYNSVMFQEFIYFTRWKILMSSSPLDHVTFFGGHDFEFMSDGNRGFGRWLPTNDSIITFKTPSEEFHFTLVFADKNLLAFHEVNTDEYLVLVATNTYKEHGLTTIEGVLNYILQAVRPQATSSRLSAYTSVATGAGLGHVIYYNHHGNDSQEHEDEDEYEDGYENEYNDEYEEGYEDGYEDEYDEEFGDYGDFTKEEIIYDYLQRQEEAQAEEDYYLQQMQDDE